MSRRVSRADLGRQVKALALELREAKGKVANRAFELLEARQEGYAMAHTQVAEAFLWIYKDMTTRGMFARQVQLKEYAADLYAYQLRDPSVQISPARAVRALVEIPTLLAVWTLLAQVAKDLPSPALGRREERVKFHDRPIVYVLKA